MPKTGKHVEFAYRLGLAALEYKRQHGGRRLDRQAMVEAVVGEAGKGGSKATASAWFNGHHLPSVPQMAAIARFVGVNPGWLAFNACPMLYGMAATEVTLVDQQPPRYDDADGATGAPPRRPFKPIDSDAIAAEKTAPSRRKAK
jgi:hypothetical protein